MNPTEKSNHIHKEQIPEERQPISAEEYSQIERLVNELKVLLQEQACLEEKCEKLKGKLFKKSN